MTIQELIDAAKCYECIPSGTQLAIQTYLLNTISGSVFSGGVTCGEGDPAGDPGSDCGLYVNTLDDSLWRWNGTDWAELIS